MSTTIDLLESRVALLEDVVNSVQIALTNLATSEALNQIILLVQTDIQDLQTDIENLRTEVALIRGEVFR
jgi:hypothetical protein